MPQPIRIKATANPITIGGQYVTSDDFGYVVDLDDADVRYDLKKYIGAYLVIGAAADTSFPGDSETSRVVMNSRGLGAYNRTGHRTTFSVDSGSGDTTARQIGGKIFHTATNTGPFASTIDTNVASVYKADVLNCDPFAYYRFTETSGTVAHDEVGRRHDGTYSGAFSLGSIDTVLDVWDDTYNALAGVVHLDTVILGTGKMTTNLPFNYNKPISFESWVYLDPAALPTSATGTLFSLGGINFQVQQGAAGHVRIGFSTSGNNSDVYGVDQAISTAGWHYMAATISPQGLYKSKIFNYPTLSTTLTQLVGSTNTGAVPSAGGPVVLGPFGSKICEFAIYNYDFLADASTAAALDHYNYSTQYVATVVSQTGIYNYNAKGTPVFNTNPNGIFTTGVTSVDASKSTMPLVWHPLTLSTNVSAYVGYATPAYAIDAFRQVHLRGLLRVEAAAFTANYIVATLPAPSATYAPLLPIVKHAGAGGATDGSVRLDIQTNGGINLVSASGVGSSSFYYISLEDLKWDYTQ